MPTGVDAAENRAEDEAVKLWAWRCQAAREAGCTAIQSEILADRGVHADQIRALAAQGCPPDLIVELLR